MLADLPMGSKKITGLANGTAAQDAVTKAQLDAAAAGTDFVGLTGDETISGVKTFSSIPVGPGVPSTANQFASKGYVDLRALDSAVVHVTGSETVAGVKTFSSIPVLPASDPTTDNQLARKAYVDTKLTAPSTSALPVGCFAILVNNTGGNVAADASVAGSGLNIWSNGAGDGSAQSGTWKNIHGVTVTTNDAGLFVRTA
jgi:hypothetical protein